MPWEYLTQPEFDVRLLPIAEAVQPFCTGARVLDLDCGVGHMAALLKGYAEYYGNDTHEPFVEAAWAQAIPNATFEVLPDERVDQACDVLLYLGMGGGEFTGEPLESHTAIESFFRLAAHRPKVAAVEMVRWWQERFRAADMFSERLGQLGYAVHATGNVDVPGEQFWCKRQWMVFTRPQDDLSEYVLEIELDQAVIDRIAEETVRAVDDGLLNEDEALEAAGDLVMQDALRLK